MCRYYCADPNYPVCPLVEAGYPTEGHWRKAMQEMAKRPVIELPPAGDDEPTRPGGTASMRCSHSWYGHFSAATSTTWRCALCGAVS